jgi:hypothetical protein
MPIAGAPELSSHFLALVISLSLNGAKVRRKFLFPATASSEFFATDLVVIAITNENVLGAFGDKLACET